MIRWPADSRRRDRGRAHLEQLLGRAEKVVRITPADVLVLVGVNDTEAEAFDGMLEMLHEAGVTARGLVMLGSGADVDSIDMEELRLQDELAGQTDEGATVRGSTTRGVMATVQCPRGCGTLIPVTLDVHVIDDGEYLRVRSTGENFEVGQHALVCAGEEASDV